MTFARETLDELRQQTQADIQSALPSADALLRYSNLAIIAAVVAAATNGHYGYLDYIALQATPFTATNETLEGWAAFKSVTRKPATVAIGSLAFTGNAGTVIPAGTSVLRNDGFAYATSADVSLGNGVAVPVAAITAGVAGNCDAGTAFTLSSGISGVGAVGQAIGPITGGADVEKDDSLRSRMLLAFANPPQGGSKNDYRRWALAVPGVTRCWPVPNGMGPSTVVLYFMMDVAQAAHGGFPQGTNGVAAGEARDTAATGDQLALANAIFAVQPVTPVVYAVALQPNVLGFAIAGIPSASPSVKAAITAAIDNALLLNGEPGGTTDVSAIESAIAAVNGSAGFVITAITASAGSVSLGPAGNIISTQGHIPQRGSITWL
ncbi:baseplate J/gp47 family protein [Sphingomonas sp. CARO-RG-8B-R24-01]|uniref:baseplate J/gp47 family protein n=1 Tax=Sphingomonas sp. CARO-RG-8B-R24-01 TaxID=2914831 RepID=UPI001F5A815A|nr:baseplate J/gp47 family protein [Sphingomonas sp. CARO-RG-8B-R24-01]